jgi:hypothetical protein
VVSYITIDANIDVYDGILIVARTYFGVCSLTRSLQLLKIAMHKIINHSSTYKGTFLGWQCVYLSEMVTRLSLEGYWHEAPFWAFAHRWHGVDPEHLTLREWQRWHL